MSRFIRIASWLLFGLLFVEMLWDSAHFYAKEPNQLLSVGLVTLVVSCAVVAYFLLPPLWQQRVHLTVLGLAASLSGVFCVWFLYFFMELWALPASDLLVKWQVLASLLAVVFVSCLVASIYAKKFFKTLKSIPPKSVI